MTDVLFDLPSWMPPFLADLIGWLFAPVHSGAIDELNRPDFWHAVLMSVAGGVLVPVVVLAARYWKIVPGQDWPRVVNHKGWQRVHDIGGGVAVISLLGGAYLAFSGMSLHQHLAHPHAWAGWFVTLMLVLLIINIAIRGSIGGPGKHQERTLVHLHDVPGDHYDMTRRRRFFEHTHRLLGYGLLIAMMGTIISGFWFVNVPRGIALGMGLWWVLLAVLAFRWERQGRAVDGYQARWGPSMSHPGNRIPVIGWRQRRYTEDEYRQLSWGGRHPRWHGKPKVQPILLGWSGPQTQSAEAGDSQAEAQPEKGS